MVSVQGAMLEVYPRQVSGGKAKKKDSAVLGKSVPGCEIFGRQIREELSSGRFYRRFVG